jgi:energy-coupling factor transporter ATP-binding protein EcfA2
MQRRLTFAMALVGNPKLIILGGQCSCVWFGSFFFLHLTLDTRNIDEPTAGLDPITRQTIWRACEKLKRDRLILLCTHSMDEAESLADKIAILALGRLRAVGTVEHLKARFGVGYRVTINAARHDTAAVNRLYQSIVGALPSLRPFGSVSASSIVFSVPVKALADLQALLALLERADGDLDKQVAFWHVAQTDLEDLFMRITHGNDTYVDKKESRATLNCECNARGRRARARVCARVALSGLFLIFFSAHTYTHIVATESEQILGSVSIEPHTSLAVVRLMIENGPAQLGDVKQFVFVRRSGTGAVERAEENSLLAVDYAPCVFLRAAADDADADDDADDNAKARLEARIAALTAELATERSEHARTRAELDSLRQQLQTLQSKLENLSS